MSVIIDFLMLRIYKRIESFKKSSRDCNSVSFVFYQLDTHTSLHVYRGGSRIEKGEGTPKESGENAKINDIHDLLN